MLNNALGLKREETFLLPSHVHLLLVSGSTSVFSLFDWQLYFCFLFLVTFIGKLESSTTLLPVLLRTPLISWSIELLLNCSTSGF